MEPTSAVPALVFCGTLDGRTDIQDQRQAVAGLSKASLITVRNAGHNMLDAPSTQMLELIHGFMTGDTSHAATIAVPLPDMAGGIEAPAR